jgi:hypothetical protein
VVTESFLNSNSTLQQPTELGQKIKSGVVCDKESASDDPFMSILMCRMSWFLDQGHQQVQHHSVMKSKADYVASGRLGKGGSNNQRLTTHHRPRR